MYDDPWYSEEEEAYLEEDFDFEEQDFSLTSGEFYADTLTSPHPVTTTSRYDPQSGGCWLPMLIAPLLVLALGSIFAAWVQTQIAAPPHEVRQAAVVAAPPAADGAPATDSSLAPFFSPSVQYWHKDILRWARQWSIDPNLVATVMQIESCGNPTAISRSGAIGLFQVMPFHFQASENPYDPDTNAARGMAYLQRALNAFGQDPRLALAGYNGGIGGASRTENLWPAETVRYAYWGSGIYADAAAGKKHSPRLQEWLEAGGASLCAQAEAALLK